MNAHDCLDASAQVLTSLDAIREIAPEWNDLLTRSGCRNPFVSAHWMITWLTHLGTSRTPFVIIIRDDAGRLVGLAPLSIETIAIGPISVRRL